MRVLIYEHCPFCVRVQMMLNIKQIAHETTVLLNDDEATPIQLVGKKVVPILQFSDGSAMAESLAIVRYLDTHYATPIVQWGVRERFTQWMDELRAVIPYLTTPRIAQLPFKEFATPSARAYFIEKKTAMIGDFSNHLANTQTYLHKLAPLLESLCQQLPAPAHLSEEDFVLFPILRTLTVVKDLHLPEAIAAYLQTMSEKTQIALLSAQAI